MKTPPITIAEPTSNTIQLVETEEPAIEPEPRLQRSVFVRKPTKQFDPNQKKTYD